MKRNFSIVVLFLVVFSFCGCGSSGDSNSGDSNKIGMKVLAQMIADGETSEAADDRVLIVDTRDSQDYLTEHIQDALNVPYDLVSEDGLPLYTNGVDTVSTDASEEIADSWMKHILVNQLVNDFSSTYQDSTLIFYGDNAKEAAELAESIGYTDVLYLSKSFSNWANSYPDYVKSYAPGVISVDNDSFIFSGSINPSNYENLSTLGTHHGITYKNGGSSYYSFLLADIPPFLFQEMLTSLGASPEGNMADGIYYGSPEDYSGKHVNGQRVDFEITWESAERYYSLSEFFVEKAGFYDSDPAAFTALGIEPRIGGTRDSNLNWNPGCIFCLYSCVCGITSNNKANENNWNADGGIYDLMNDPDNPRNFYAGRYYPNEDIMPDAGTVIQIRVTILSSN